MGCFVKGGSLWGGLVPSLLLSHLCEGVCVPVDPLLLPGQSKTVCRLIFAPSPGCSFPLGQALQAPQAPKKPGIIRSRLCPPLNPKYPHFANTVQTGEPQPGFPVPTRSPRLKPQRPQQHPLTSRLLPCPLAARALQDGDPIPAPWPREERGQPRSGRVRGVRMALTLNRHGSPRPSQHLFILRPSLCRQRVAEGSA